MTNTIQHALAKDGRVRELYAIANAKAVDAKRQHSNTETNIGTNTNTKNNHTINTDTVTNTNKNNHIPNS